MAKLQASEIAGNLLVGDGVAGAIEANGNFEVAGSVTMDSGNAGQYKICRQQGGTAGLVEWVDFAVYDTNGTTRLF